MKYEILVQLKKDVFDPQSKAIHSTLQRVGFEQIKKVTVSKRYIVDLDDDSSNTSDVIEKLAAKYLSNPVSETYTVSRLK